MLKIEANLPDDLAAALLTAAANEEMSIEEFAIHVFREHLKVSSPAPADIFMSALVMAIEVAGYQPHGKEFVLADLIEPTTWSLLEPGQRKQIGKKFRQKVEKDGVAKFVRRRSDNHAVYARA
ncbi:hypothetical protein WK90_01620 [Burkholderia cepacia]|uniref:DUF1413 domain-containing protein n=1 Tax=Burkholderia cepacia TaxID=292 RepID=UPI000751E18B|nr:DUF1413 domain-containing protein [Burkholderia cepacia]KVV49710.1 hypothetical protein WK83_35685 [Burkholderia cepacia]KVV71710.1 hypothetical protein WK84_00330 [Burkholderia cepacia]KVV73064.1 hypothetical protein WK85_15140 [Burkholderia cepacia]KVV88238.1 hypothetical protein WK86_06155 [Burkholderia cepacia]KVV91360.1 hypothetical protein WK88_22175 [Burkholderia cepacia]